MRAIVLIAEGFEDSEFFYPYYRLMEEGWDVDVAGPEKGSVKGKHGYTFETTLTFSEMDEADYDLLVLPGGKAPETVRLHREAVELTRTMAGDGRTVAAICHGPQILISADVLRGRRATCYKAIRDDVKVAGAKYVDEDTVVDGNLVTARTPADLPAFCRAIFATVRQTV